MTTFVSEKPREPGGKAGGKRTFTVDLGPADVLWENRPGNPDRLAAFDDRLARDMPKPARPGEPTVKDELDAVRYRHG